ncbi:hypothetical protein RSA46_12695 [Pseudomonas oryzihabitans]|nr:hypothetical protein RSA46_12695 [Pseudomonas psychrotolerans]
MYMLDHISKQGSKLLLLDEWDSNLDNKNLEIVDCLIEEMALDMLVVEIRHNRIKTEKALEKTHA